MKRIQQVFWELSSLRFLIASFLTFALYHLMDPFITVWLGEEYILPRSVLIVILTNFFISQFQGYERPVYFRLRTVSRHMAPVATLAITVAVALAGGYLWGLPGVLLGDIASSITVISIWKPYFLYKEGFKMSVKSYWKNIFRYLLLAVLSWGLTDVVLCFLPLAERPGDMHVDCICAGFLSGISADIVQQLLLLFGRDAFAGEAFAA